MVHRTFSEVHVSDLVNSEIAIISNHRLADNFLLNFVLFPTLLLQVENIVQNGVLLETSRHEVDLQKESFLVEIHRGQKSLDHGNIGLLHMGTLVLHHIIEL